MPPTPVSLRAALFPGRRSLSAGLPKKSLIYCNCLLFDIIPVNRDLIFRLEKGYSTTDGCRHAALQGIVFSALAQFSRALDLSGGAGRPYEHP